MSKALVLLFSLPISFYISFAISEKYFNKSKKVFHWMFYSILRIFALILGVSFLFIMQTFAIKVSLIKQVAMIPMILLVGAGFVFGAMCLINPLEFAKFLKQHKKTFLVVLGIFVFLSILDNFL